MAMLPLKIALRYLTSKKSHNVINVISGISICGVAISTMALVCVLSVFNGFQDLIAGKLANLDPQLKIMPVKGKSFNCDTEAFKTIEELPYVEVFSPLIDDNALAVSNGSQLPVRVLGVPDNFNSLTAINDMVRTNGGYLLKDSIAEYAIISIGVADALKACNGGAVKLELYAPKRHGRVNMANPMTSFNKDSIYVSGIYMIEQNEYDINTIIVPIHIAGHLLEYENEVSSIGLRLTNDTNQDTAINEISEILGNDYIVKDRLMQQDDSFRMMKIEKWVTFLILLLIAFIASFNVISTLSMLIVEKRNDISTLMHLGADNKLIYNIFIVEGWLISMIGVACGIVLGTALSLLQQHFGIIKLAGNPSAMIIDSYPVTVQYGDIAVVAAVMVLLGFITSWIPVHAYMRRLRAKS